VVVRLLDLTRLAGFSFLTVFLNLFSLETGLSPLVFCACKGIASTSIRMPMPRIFSAGLTITVLITLYPFKKYTVKQAKVAKI
jgi:hypothetical protein